MTTLRELSGRYLEQVREGLKEIREAPEEERYGKIIDLIAPIVLSPTQRLKLREQLKRDFGFPVRDFDQVYGSDNRDMWHKD